jgi:hypothetical protein
MSHRLSLVLFGSGAGYLRFRLLVYSLVTTAKHHDVNPTEYLEFVINDISDYPYHKLADLLPQNWKAKFACQAGQLSA